MLASREIDDAVVVITGASSGIGRASARALAAEGAHLVLAARREEPLREAAAECEARGGRAIAVATDVTNEGAVQHLANEATDTFGTIDTWVNNAAVTQFGRFEETPPEAFRQVIETNLFGYVYGARAALRVFREHGRGVLINIASLVAEAGQPYATAYVVSKYGVRGLSTSLRQELAVDGADDIHVSTILPAVIDTPLFSHAANYSGQAIKAMPPVYSAERVARAVVKCARKPRAELFVGNSGKIISSQHKLAPRRTERQMAQMVHCMHFEEGKEAERTPGNLFEPMADDTATVSGGWKTVTGTHKSEGGTDKDTVVRGILYGGAALAGTVLAAALANRLASFRWRGFV